MEMSEKRNFNDLWQNMVQSSGSKFDGDLKNFMGLFCDLLEIKEVDHAQREEFYIFYLDMSSLQMKVTEITPFFVTRITTDDKHEINNLFLKIKSKIYKENIQNQISFILVIGQTEFLKRLCKDSLLDLVIFDELKIKQIGSSEKPRGELIKICKDQINVQRLSPYETVDPVVGKMFYGRKWEMKQLVNRIDMNFVIAGCRKIGKSSLLLNAFHRMCESETTHPVFLDCYPYKAGKDFVEEVVTRLEIRELRRMTMDKFHNFLRRMKNKYKKRITFFMDEVDGLLENDKNNGWKLFYILSSAHAEGYCRFIITGYRVVFAETLNLLSPIFHFMEPIRIHDLDHDSAVALITQPIRDMGILFEERGQIIDRILKKTERQPNLIQFICKKLIEIESKRNKNIITYNDLLEVEKSSEYRHYMTDTFLVNFTNREQLVVFCMLDFEEFTLEDIDREMEKRGISLKLNEMERICAVLEMANVFRKTEKKYTFSNSALPEILRMDYDVHYISKKLVHEVD